MANIQAARAAATGIVGLFFLIASTFSNGAESNSKTAIRLASTQFASTTSDNVVPDAPAETVAARPITPSSVTPAMDEPSGLVTFHAPDSVLRRQWETVRSDIAAEMQQVAKCRISNGTSDADCNEAARRFISMVDEARAHTGLARVGTVNRSVNMAIRYTSDLIQHGVADVWSSPLASLQTGRGDCEDYAIAKYVILREAGVPEEEMRILLVRDKKVHEDHAILEVRNAGSWIVLDNRNLALVSANELPRFTPLFALDNNGVRHFASPYLAQIEQKAG